jgi:hypothetical protein
MEHHASEFSVGPRWGQEPWSRCLPYVSLRKRTLHLSHTRPWIGGRPSWSTRSTLDLSKTATGTGRGIWKVGFHLFHNAFSTEYVIQEVLGRTNRLLSLIRLGPHWKRRVQQFFYCCVCIRYSGSISTEPLSSNDRGIFTEPFPNNDNGIFTEPLSSNDRGDKHTHTHTQQRILTSLLYIFKNRKVG